MLPKREVLIRMVRAKISFMLYGPKASGKTSLIRSVFKQTNCQPIQINCTLANKRSSFLKLFNVELNKHLCRKKIEFQKLPHPLNLDVWINKLKNILTPEIIEQLDNMYIFMDNIQEMLLSQTFLPSFYNACQREFPFRFNFVLCGINFLKKQYTLELPFRTMAAFCMQRPDQEYEKIIMNTAAVELKKMFKKVDESQIEICAKKLMIQIRAVFDNVSMDLDKVDSITTNVVESIGDLLDSKDLVRSMSKLINTDRLKPILKQIFQHGLLRQAQIKRKIIAEENKQQVNEATVDFQYYPNLILTSIHLADYYNEKQDKRRFHDYKSRTLNRNKDLKKNEFKVGKHHINRIIAIAESLESQAKDNDKQKIMQHHTLDFYAQFEYLKKINRLKFMGNKLTGVVKEENVKAFLRTNQLRYEQFMN